LMLPKREEYFSGHSSALPQIQVSARANISL
jgi:hypothetical protein